MVSQPQRVKYSLCKQAAKLRDAQEGEGDVGGGQGWVAVRRPPHGTWSPSVVLLHPHRRAHPVGSRNGAREGARAGGDFAAMFNIQVT